MAEYHAESISDNKEENYSYITPIHYTNILPAIASIRDPAMKAANLIERPPKPHRGFTDAHEQSRDKTVGDDSKAPDRPGRQARAPERGHRDKQNKGNNQIPPPLPPRDIRQRKIVSKPPKSQTDLPKHQEEVQTAHFKPPDGVKTIADIFQDKARTSDELIVPNKSSQIPVDGQSKDQIGANKGLLDYDPHVVTSDSAEELDLVRELLPQVRGPADVVRLKVNDVSGYLRALGLEEYVSAFRAHKVDGELLSDLVDDELKYEFGMKGVEAKKLLKFVTKGHIPE